jgi:hypothetical protein
MVSSTVSAMASRLARLDRIPSCPMAIPSVTVIVVNSRGVPIACFTPSFTACACRFSAMLQGAASFQQVATPTKGWWISASESPMA